MNLRPGPGLLAVGALCIATAALHQPRPAIAAAATALAIALGGARRLALLACLAVTFGLIAAAPPLHHHPPRAVARRP